MSDEIDDVLQEMLDEMENSGAIDKAPLTTETPTPSTQMVPIASVAATPVVQKGKPIKAEKPAKTDKPSKAEKQDKKKLDTEIAIIDTDLKSLVGDFKSVKEELLNAVKEDRASLQEYINYFAGELKGANPKQYHAEGLTTLLGAKALTSANAVRLLDSMAKMMSACKNHPSVDGNVPAKNSLNQILNTIDIDPDDA